MQARRTEVLDRHGLVRRARDRRNRAQGTPLSAGAAPNGLSGPDTTLPPAPETVELSD